MQPAYSIARSYDWNFLNAPTDLREVEVQDCPGNWDFCGMPVRSPLGIPAGPLLNSRWILYYAARGFDVLTYKTVRSVYRACYEPPNLLPVDSGQLSGESDCVVRSENSFPIRSWAISFGMPSKSPVTWQADIEAARRDLPVGKVLVVSVVASPEPESSIETIADDFAQCARWASQSGAHVIEANLSCPNVCTQEGQLYTDPAAAELVSASIRREIGTLPLILKIGLFSNSDEAEAFVQATEDYTTALSTTNSISAKVLDGNGVPLFGGRTRGIGGNCIKKRCQIELELLHRILDRRKSTLRLIGVGGLSSATDVRERLSGGAHHVQLATAAMLDPLIGARIRNDLAAAGTQLNLIPGAS